MTGSFVALAVALTLVGFLTANFLGRGESLTATAQAGSRAQNYQLAFTEPFLFDRNLPGGIDIYKRSLQYIGYYTQKSKGGNVTFGFPVADFARMFFNYSYESVGVGDLNEALLDPSDRMPIRAPTAFCACRALSTRVRLWSSHSESLR